MSGFASLGKTMGWNSGYVAARYYNGLQSGGITTVALSVNVAYFCPMAVTEAHTFDRIACEVTTAGTAANIRMAIYNALNGTPTSLVLDAGSLAISGTGFKTSTISQLLPAGPYFLAMVADGTVTVAGLGNTQAGGWYFNGTTSFSAPDAQISGTLTFGAFPATAFAGGMGTVTYTATALPVLALRA